MARPGSICLAAILLGSAATHAAAIDEGEVRAQLVERVDGRKWGTAIVVGVSSPRGRQVISYGTLAVNDSRKADGATVFEIASLTKVLTALVLADMAKRGQVEPEAPVSTCLRAGAKVPEHGGRQITFIDLATHSSGLPLRPQNLASQTALNKYAGYTLEQLYQGLATFELPRDPGTKFEYSNWGFALLGQALAHCAGKDYQALLAERVTGPLGMRDTTFSRTAAPSRLASPYDAKLQPMPYEELGALGAAGGLYSTVDDLLAFVELFLGRGPQPLAAAATTMLEPRRPGDGSDTQMALGWRVTTSKGVRTIWSSGGADGFRSFMGFDPDARVAVVALTNGRTNVGVDDIGWHILDPRVPIVRLHPRVSVAAAALERYVGQYRFEEDGVLMTVIREEDHLVVQMTGQGPSPIFAGGPREFFPEDIEAQFVFDDSGKGPAQSLVLNQDGHSYKAVRVAAETPKQ